MKRIAGKNLVLIGFMGTGKTEVGRLLAGALNRRLVDTDQLIVEQAGMAVTGIFMSYGEDWFMERETVLLEELSGQRGLVVATGGGIVLKAKNVELLRAGGFVVWLDTEVEEVAGRLAGDTSRPELQRGIPIEEIYREREPLYRGAAHERVATTGRTPLVVAREILKLLN
jgi:shikimate kinase